MKILLFWAAIIVALVVFMALDSGRVRRDTEEEVKRDLERERVDKQQ